MNSIAKDRPFRIVELRVLLWHTTQLLPGWVSRIAHLTHRAQPGFFTGAGRSHPLLKAGPFVLQGIELRLLFLDTTRLRRAVSPQSYTSTFSKFIQPGAYLRFGLGNGYATQRDRLQSLA